MWYFFLHTESEKKEDKLNNLIYTLNILLIEKWDNTPDIDSMHVCVF